jgi:hypothetical protein
MYELKKNWKLFTSKFVGPRALVLKKNYLPGRGLTKVGKHWSFCPCSRAINGSCKGLRMSGVVPVRPPYTSYDAERAGFTSFTSQVYNYYDTKHNKNVACTGRTECAAQ